MLSISPSPFEALTSLTAPVVVAAAAFLAAPDLALATAFTFAGDFAFTADLALAEPDPHGSAAFSNATHPALWFAMARSRGVHPSCFHQRKCARIKSKTHRTDMQR